MFLEVTVRIEKAFGSKKEWLVLEDPTKDEPVDDFSIETGLITVSTNQQKLEKRPKFVLTIYIKI